MMLLKPKKRRLIPIKLLMITSKYLNNKKCKTSLKNKKQMNKKIYNHFNHMLFKQMLINIQMTINNEMIFVIFIELEQ